jgi:hypothetical protein
MDLSLPFLWRLARYTAQQPRQGARLVLDADLPVQARWLAVALTAIVSAVLVHISFLLLPSATQAQYANAMSSPLETALIQGVMMVMTALIATWIGRWSGGKGRFAEALVLMAWLQCFLLSLQAIQILFELVLPPVTDLIGIASIAIFLWLLSNFIAELHGFKSVLKVFGAVLGVMMGFAVILVIVLMPFVNAGA